MGEVRTEITLVNIEDQGVANRGYMPQEEVRRLTVNAVVDTGATTLIINEETRAKLGLRVEDAGEVTGDLRSLAGGVKTSCRITETVKICWKNRRASCEAVVIPDEEDVLLGALPLETMDLTINPRQQEVIGAHGDKVRYVVK